MNVVEKRTCLFSQSFQTTAVVFGGDELSRSFSNDRDDYFLAVATERTSVMRAAAARCAAFLYDVFHKQQYEYSNKPSYQSVITYCRTYLLAMNDEPSDPRKRSRPPTPTFDAPLSSSTNVISKEERWMEQLSKENTRTSAINELLQLTSRADVSYYSLVDDQLLRSLVTTAFAEMGWTFQSETTRHATFSSHDTWNHPPTEHLRAWTRHCQQSPASMVFQNQVLACILMILRNLSFAAANGRLMAYTDSCVALLVGCLYGSEDIALSALQTVVNLQPHLDVSGQKLLVDALFYAQTSDGPVVSKAGRLTLGQWGMGGVWLSRHLDGKEDSMTDVSTEFVLCHTIHQLVTVWSIFSALRHLIMGLKTSRPVLLLALDFMQEAITSARVGVVGNVDDQVEDGSIPSLRAILVHMPKELVQQFASFLYVPRLGSDALDYVDPVRNIVTRVTTLKLLANYDATVDTDVRDRALDVLVPLLELDSRMADRLPYSCGDALIPILTSTAGRTEAPGLACQLLKEFAQAHSMNKWQEQLVEMASRNEKVSQLVWNHLTFESVDVPEFVEESLDD